MNALITWQEIMVVQTKVGVVTVVRNWSDSGHVLKIEPTGFSDGFLMGYVGNRRGIMNDSSFVLEQLEG